MYLSMAMIVSELAGACSYTRIGSNPRDLEIAHVEIADTCIPMRSDTLYLVDAAIVSLDFETAPRHVVCIEETADPGRRFCDDFIVMPSKSLAYALSRIHGAFRRFEEWDDHLREIELRNGSISELLQASMEAVASDILVHDRDLRTISYCGHECGSTETPSLFRQNEIMNSSAIDTFLKTCEINAKGKNPFDIRGPHLWVSSKGPHCLNLNVRYRGDFLARIVFTTARASDEPEPKDFGIITILGSYVKAILVTTFSQLLGIEQGELSRTIGGILDGEKIPLEKIDAATQAFGWNCWEDSFIIAKVAVRNNRERIRTNSYERYALMPIFSRASEIMHDAHPMLYKNDGIIVINMTRRKSNPQSVMKQLEQIALESDCRFGISGLTVGIKHLGQAYNEACIAVDFMPSSKDDNQSAITSVENVLLPFVDRCILNEITAISFCPSGLLRIVHHDNEHGTNFRETLQAYLDANCSATACAHALFIQRSTLRYRLDRINDLLGCDLGNPDVRLKLNLALRLLNSLQPRAYRRI